MASSHCVLWIQSSAEARLRHGTLLSNNRRLFMFILSSDDVSVKECDATAYMEQIHGYENVGSQSFQGGI